MAFGMNLCYKRRIKAFPNNRPPSSVRAPETPTDANAQCFPIQKPKPPGNWNPPPPPPPWNLKPPPPPPPCLKTNCWPPGPCPNGLPWKGCPCCSGLFGSSPLSNLALSSGSLSTSYASLMSAIFFAACSSVTPKELALSGWYFFVNVR